MTVPKDISMLFDFSLIEKDKRAKDVIPTYLERQTVLRGIIHNIQEQKRASLNEIAGLMRCLSFSDEENVRADALAAICNLGEKRDKEIAITIASFDENEDVLSVMLEEANNLESNFFKPIAQRFVSYESGFISDYAKGMISRSVEENR